MAIPGLIPLAIWICQLTFAQVTIGPLAPYSINEEPAYSSARPCAAGCLYYNDQLQAPCGVGSFYQDLAIGLACGCNAPNLCYCSEPTRPQASSYVSDCVIKACGTTIDYQAEITSMLSLYDEYCATATIEVSTTRKSTTPASRTAPPTAGSTTTTDVTAAETDTPSTSGGTGSSSDSDNGGLKKSDIIALAASLGVGVPSLLIALITLCVQIRKRRRIAAETSATAQPSTSNVNLHAIPPVRPTVTTMDAAAQAEYDHMHGYGPTMQQAGGYYTPSQSSSRVNAYGQSNGGYPIRY